MHRSTRALLALAAAMLASCAVAAAATRAPTSTAISKGHGQGFLTLDGQVQSASGGVQTGTVRFTITNASTHRRLGAFTQPAGSLCALDRSTHGSRVTFQTPKPGMPGDTGPDAFHPCRIGKVSGPKADRYKVTARYAGTGAYQPSKSLAVGL